MILLKIRFVIAYVSIAFAYFTSDMMSCLPIYNYANPFCCTLLYLFRRNATNRYIIYSSTVVPNKSDSDVLFCLQLLSKTLTCTLHLSYNFELIDHVCINSILRRGLIHK